MKKTAVALTSVLLVAFAQSVLAQSAIETARAATVTIVVAGPDGQSHGSGFDVPPSVVPVLMLDLGPWVDQ